MSEKWAEIFECGIIQQKAIEKRICVQEWQNYRYHFYQTELHKMKIEESIMIYEGAFDLEIKTQADRKREVAVLPQNPGIPQCFQHNHD